MNCTLHTLYSWRETDIGTATLGGGGGDLLVTVPEDILSFKYSLQQLWQNACPHSILRDWVNGIRHTGHDVCCSKGNTSHFTKSPSTHPHTLYTVTSSVLLGLR